MLLSRLKQASAALLLALALLASPAQASHCGRLCETDFWKTATTQQVEAEIKAGANPNARTIIGTTPLHRAARWETAEVVTAMLDAGADPNVRNDDGFTPLHHAAGSGTAETVNALLDAGANPKARTEDGDTPFDLAKDNDKLTGTHAWWRLNDAQYD